MKKRWAVGTTLVLAAILTGKAITLAQQKSGRSPNLAVLPPPLPADNSPKGWRAAGDPPSMAVISSPPQAPPMPAVADDPMGAVDSFLERNQKEADDALNALGQEAEQLRTRLQKVEAALARWQGVSEALKGQATTPQVEPAATPETVPPATLESPKPRPAVPLDESARILSGNVPPINPGDLPVPVPDPIPAPK